MLVDKIHQLKKEIIYDTKSWIVENFKKYQDEGHLHFEGLTNHYHNSCIETNSIENIFLGRKTINTKI